MKTVLIIGSGGREHALGWKLAQSPTVHKLFFAPGNAGTAAIGTNLILDIYDHPAVIETVKNKHIDFVVVAPDDPLANGLVDSLLEAGIPAFGPTKEASQLEASKAFAKNIMKEAGVPTAEYEAFTDYEKAIAYIEAKQAPIVIKASGLALGKGVVIAQTIEDARKALYDIMVNQVHGDAGKEVVIEELLVGQEVSFHAFCDGEYAVVFPTGQDHKQVFDGDTGPNTGGMGTIAPVSWVTMELIAEVKIQVIDPILKAMAKRGTPFKGCLYPGLMITSKGIKVLEFNVRFGDPETQSFMRLLKSDLFEIMQACVAGTLNDLKIEWSNDYACCVVLASGGYPGVYKKGFIINGLDTGVDNGIVVFHAGTSKRDNEIVTDGGRVLGISATGSTLDEALNKAYAAIGESRIHFEAMIYRTDIGRREAFKSL